MSVTVRFAKLKDGPAMVRLGEEFHAASPYQPIPFSQQSILDFLSQSMTDPERAVFVAEKDDQLIGIACIAASPFFFNIEQRYAAELFWYVRPDCRDDGVGRQLLLAMEAWASSKRCAFIAMISFGSNGPEGYTQIETSHVRRLN